MVSIDAVGSDGKKDYALETKKQILNNNELKIVFVGSARNFCAICKVYGIFISNV